MDSAMDAGVIEKVEVGGELVEAALAEHKSIATLILPLNVRMRRKLMLINRYRVLGGVVFVHDAALRHGYER